MRWKIGLGDLLHYTHSGRRSEEASLDDKPEYCDGAVFKTGRFGVPCWIGGLRSCQCHCCGSGHCYGTDSTPGPGTLHATGTTKKKKKKMDRFNSDHTALIGMSASELEKAFVHCFIV